MQYRNLTISSNTHFCPRKCTTFYWTFVLEMINHDIKMHENLSPLSPHTLFPCKVWAEMLERWKTKCDVNGRDKRTAGWIWKGWNKYRMAAKTQSQRESFFDFFYSFLSGESELRGGINAVLSSTLFLPFRVIIHFPKMVPVRSCCCTRLKETIQFI